MASSTVHDCPRCGGSGEVPGHVTTHILGLVTCPGCHGQGRVSGAQYLAARDATDGTQLFWYDIFEPIMRAKWPAVLWIAALLFDLGQFLWYIRYGTGNGYLFVLPIPLVLLITNRSLRASIAGCAIIIVGLAILLVVVLFCAQIISQSHVSVIYPTVTPPTVTPRPHK